MALERLIPATVGSRERGHRRPCLEEPHVSVQDTGEGCKGNGQARGEGAQSEKVLEEELPASSKTR